jgi:Ca-activated chloride channel homolog
MIRKSVKSSAILILLGTMILSGGCEGKKETAKKKTTSPVATARQAISTPTLAAPTGKQGKAKARAPEAKAKAKPASKPRGPVTLPPSSIAPLDAAVDTMDGTTPSGAQKELKSLAAPSLPPAIESARGEAQPVAYKPKLVSAQTNVDVILDASGSMAAQFGATSKTKFDMLKEAFYDVIYEMGGQQKDFPRNVAVRLFGSEHPASDKMCKDSKLIASMGAPNLSGIRAVVDGLTAQGTSPISYALSQASKDFPAGGRADRVMVLISDGGDNCGGDPCKVARDLQTGITKTIINVVAFDISPSEEKGLKCIAEASDGKYFLARNESELRQAIGNAVNSTVPYNLKLTALAGASPIPFDLTVYRAGTESSVLKGKSFGTKLLTLKSGSYDILIEYAQSPETRKPSKILKGVEILSTTKVEQTITFDLGEVKLMAVDNEGKIVPATFTVTETEPASTIARMETGNAAKSFFLATGTYDIAANLVESGPDEEFTVIERGLKVEPGRAIERTFRFQKGTLALKGITTQKKSIPLLFQAYKAGRADVLIASGAFNAEGGSVLLAPGNYDLLAIGTDPDMAASPRTMVSNVEIRAAETSEVTANFEMGMLSLSAIDGKGNRLPASFVINDHTTSIKMATLVSESGGAVDIPLPPGAYDVVASSLKSILEPKPSVPMSNIVVTAKTPVSKVIKFVLGTLRLRGSNAKEEPLRTQFTIYRTGSNEIVSSAPESNDWMVFDLAPGIYDALGTDIAATKSPKPMIWLRDLRVEDGKSISHEAIFTNGKLKIIGRGPNSKVIVCHFKIFKYGMDGDLINGVTGDDWEIFEIAPGRYYLEASYHDEAQSVLLKKWVNITIGDNEVVEQVLRF